MRDDVYVYLRNDMPDTVREMVMPCLDGYTVYINEHLDDEHRIKAYEHALKHIDNGDFDVDCIDSVQEIEARAHGVKGAEFVKAIKKKRRRTSAKVSFLKKSGYDFFAAAERKYLEPEM